MAGATTAAPNDAMGALYWNPATIGTLDRSELSVGLGLLFSDYSVASGLGASSGATSDQAGVFPIPNVGWVHRTPNPHVTIGLGMNSVAGFKTNLPTDPTNPVLTPPGQVSSEASFLQLTPVVSLAMTSKLSVALGPAITLGQATIDPFLFDSANADSSYPSGRASRYHWGGGFQLGVHYAPSCCWQMGASIKSPAWMEEFEFFGQDENGASRILHADLDLPMIVSLGVAYKQQDWLLAVDARYLDYKNTSGFGDPAVFDGTGALGGLDWSSVFSVAIGAQKQLTDRWTARAGYLFNQSPIRNSETFLNLGTPLFYQHMISGGASYALCDSMDLSLAYSFFVDSDRTGPIISPTVGPVPGSSVTTDLAAHLLSFGMTVRH